MRLGTFFGLSSLLVGMGILANMPHSSEGARRQLASPASVTAIDYVADAKSLLRCGGDVESLSTNSVSTSESLTISLDTPSEGTSGRSLEIVATLKNISSTPLSAVGPDLPSVSGITDDQVMLFQGPMRSEGLKIQLDPGESKTIPLTVVAGRCIPAGLQGVSQEDFARSHPLPSGSYELYGVYSFQLRGQRGMKTIASSAVSVIFK